MLKNNIKLVVNLAVIGNNITGMGMFALESANSIKANFSQVEVIGDKLDDTENKAYCLYRNITIGSGKFAPFWRLLWQYKKRFDDEQLVFSPTHHGFFKHNNQIITIHDLIPIFQPKQYRMQNLYFRFVLPQIIKKCRAIFTVSESSKNDIVKYYNIDSKYVYVVPNGVDMERFHAISGDKKKQLLVVGAAYRHKNVHEILENHLLWETEYNLVVVSARGEYKKELENIVKEKKLMHRVDMREYVSNNELMHLMQTSSALIYPSLCEGFGIPPMEALACGCPVVLSDIAVHKEIYQNAAIYITPGNQESWKRAFNQLKEDVLIQEKMIAAQDVLNQYTWKRSGEILKGALLHIEPNLKQYLISTGE